MGLAVLRQAGKQRDLGSNPLRLSFLFKKVVVCGHCLVTLSLTVNETLKVVVCGHCPVTLSLTIKQTLKWLSSLPVLMQESFWW